MSILTPNMGLYQPLIGIDSGLTWEIQMNSNATQIDQHNHGSGSGVQITPSGININSDLTFNSNNVIALRSVRFTAQASPLALGTDIGCLYVSGVDLYYNDVSGNQIRITSGGLVNATSSGISSGTASASFSSGVLIVDSASSTPASIQVGSVLVGNSGVSGSKYVTITPTAALANNYSLVLPAVSPSGTQLLVIDASGNIAPNAGAVSATVANNIAAATTVTGANSIGATMTLAPNLGTSAKNFKSSGDNVIVSNTNTTNGLSVIRGFVTQSGSITGGEGFSAVRNSAGVYAITFTTAFSDAPIVIPTISPTTSAVFATAVNITTTGMLIQNFNMSFTVTDSDFMFIAIGQRA